jgi:hypothetical protein
MKKFTDLKHVDNLSEAPYILMAYMRYVDNDGKTLGQSYLPVGRAFSKQHAKRIEKSILYMHQSQSIGFENGIEKFRNVSVKRPRLNYIDSNGLTTFEIVDSFVLITK